MDPLCCQMTDNGDIFFIAREDSSILNSRLHCTYQIYHFRLPFFVVSVCRVLHSIVTFTTDTNNNNWLEYVYFVFFCSLHRLLPAIFHKILRDWVVIRAANLQSQFILIWNCCRQVTRHEFKCVIILIVCPALSDDNNCSCCLLLLLYFYTT